MEKNRKPNLIDAYRFLAAACVVWYHSNYLLSNSIYPTVVYWRDFVIGWSMPFFYVTVTVFAYRSFLKNSSFSKLGQRSGKFFLLVVTYGLVFEAMKIILYLTGKNDFYSPLVITNYETTFWWERLFVWFRSGNNSPLYFIFDTMIITLLAFVLTRIPLALRKIILLTIVVFAILAVTDLFPLVTRFNQSIWWIQSNRTITTFAIGLIIAWRWQDNSIKSPQEISNSRTVALLIFPVLAVGGVYFLIENFVTRLFLLAVILAVTMVIGKYYSSIKNPILEKLAVWGQKYSLGIYLWHPITLAFLDNILPVVWQRLFFPHNDVVIYIFINILGFLSAWFITSILLSRLSILVSTNSSTSH